MLYTVKCFWPGVTEDELRLAAARARSETDHRLQTVFRGALYLPGHELVLCLFESSSPISVKRASEDAGMPCERVMETLWVDPDATNRHDLRLLVRPDRRNVWDENRV
jgi:hypothetical protein